MELAKDETWLHCAVELGRPSVLYENSNGVGERAHGAGMEAVGTPTGVKGLRDCCPRSLCTFGLVVQFFGIKTMLGDL